MASEGDIRSYTATELLAMIEAGHSRSNLDAVRAMTEEQLEAAIASDPDEVGLVFDWDKAVAVYPAHEAAALVRVDEYVLAWFKQGGPDYRQRINLILADYVSTLQSRTT